RAAPPDDRGGAVVELDPDLAGDLRLRGLHEPPQVSLELGEPETVVRRLGDLVGDHPAEAQLVLREGQALERAVGRMEHDGSGRLVDLAALDPDEPVLDVVDATDAVAARQ